MSISFTECYMKNLFPVLGIMVCLYVAAILLGRVNKKLELDNKHPILQNIIAVACIAFLFCSAPIGIVLYFLCPPSK